MEHHGAGSTGIGRNQELSPHHRINQCYWVMTPFQKSTVLDQVASCSSPKQVTFKGGNKDHNVQDQTYLQGQCHGESKERNHQRSAGTAAPAGRCWARGLFETTNQIGLNWINPWNPHFIVALGQVGFGFPQSMFPDGKAVHGWSVTHEFMCQGLMIGWPVWWQMPMFIRQVLLLNYNLGWFKFVNYRYVVFILVKGRLIGFYLYNPGVKFFGLKKGTN